LIATEYRNTSREGRAYCIKGRYIHEVFLISQENGIQFEVLGESCLSRLYNVPSTISRTILCLWFDEKCKSI